jgi:uncharacterized membrane protein required for colicin V production
LNEIASKLTWVDYIALAALLRGLYVGYKSGLFQELLRVAAYILSVLVTLQLFGFVAQHLTLHTFLNEGSAKAVAFSSVLAAVYMAIKILRAILVKTLKVGEGDTAQRIAGALLGGARLLVLLSFFFMLIDMTPLRELKTDLHERSLTGPHISMVAPQIFDFLSRFSPDGGFQKPA